MIIRREQGERNFRGMYPEKKKNASAGSRSLRKLQSVVAKLEPLSEQGALLGFLRNADNAKILTGFVQDLANAVTDYQVRAACPSAICDEHPVRFRCNKEYTRRRGKSMRKPGTSVRKPEPPVILPRPSVRIPGTY